MATTMKRTIDHIAQQLGEDAKLLLEHKCQTVDKSQLHLPGPDFIDRVMAQTDRNPQVLRSMQSMFDHGRLGGTGFLSILPVDQGIEHSAGASFAKNPIYFDPENITGTLTSVGPVRRAVVRSPSR